MRRKVEQERKKERMGSLDEHRYDDIIGLPHHVSSVHPPMPIADRAAQFQPFAALDGYGDVIRETAEVTQREVEEEERGE